MNKSQIALAVAAGLVLTGCGRNNNEPVSSSPDAIIAAGRQAAAQQEIPKKKLFAPEDAALISQQDAASIVARDAAKDRMVIVLTKLQQQNPDFKFYSDHPFDGIIKTNVPLARGFFGGSHIQCLDIFIRRGKDSQNPDDFSISVGPNTNASKARGENDVLVYVAKEATLNVGAAAPHRNDRNLKGNRNPKTCAS